MTLFPIIFNKVKLNTSSKQFVGTLRKLCEQDFDISRSEREFDTLYKPHYVKEYEAEISKNSFKARKLDKRGYKSNPFIKNTVYGWYRQEEDSLIFKYLITFNIFTGILFLIIFAGSIYFLYDAIRQLDRSSLNSLFYAIIGPAMFIFLFNIMAEDDKMFIDSIIDKSK